MTSGESCPLCGTVVTPCVEPFWCDAERSYLRCACCALIFVPADELPSLHVERAHYDQHENDIVDPRYRTFLRRAMDPLLERIEAGASGLDFGCGSGPALAAMLRGQGYSVALYDPAYFPDTEVLAQRYDFVTCTEVIEHAHDAARTWAQLHDLLHPDGWLVVMTKRVRDRDAFSRWHYRRDPTHVRFYGVETFQWIAAHWRFGLTIASDDVCVLQRTSMAPAGSVG